MILATADVTILGAGVFGLSIAFCAAQRGARVRVIDPLVWRRGPVAGWLELWRPIRRIYGCPKSNSSWKASCLPVNFGRRWSAYRVCRLAMPIMGGCNRSMKKD